jgi:pimeloyl-ACP methyl ester carboxylesterase
MKTRSLALLSSLSLALFACGSEDDTAADTTGDTGNVDWRGCGTLGDRDVRCAEIEVPLDHDQPDGETTLISINLIPANRSEPRRGLLFVNPGGPGESGKDFALSMARQGAFDVLAPGFDVVGFDPRGVADSGDRSCGPSPTMDPEFDSIEDAVADQALEGQRCADHWGALFDHLGSNQVVRDMDAMRQALGETKLNYLGISYGTRLGALYAHTFPESVGRIVLDAAVAPQVDMVKDAREGFAQLLVLQDVFFQDCDAGVLSCPPDARALFDDMIAAADELGVGVDVAQYWAGQLAFPFTREELPFLLEQQATETDPSWLLDVAADPGIFAGIGEVANRNVTCIDATTEPASIQEFEALYEEMYEQSPVFASEASVSLMCAGWPVTRDPVPMPSAAAAPPMLVIGGTQDLLTPLSNAEEMTAALGNATLLISNHYGHSAISPDNRCVLDAISTFFTAAQLPAAGTVCEN